MKAAGISQEGGSGWRLVLNDMLYVLSFVWYKFLRMQEEAGFPAASDRKNGKKYTNVGLVGPTVLVCPA